MLSTRHGTTCTAPRHSAFAPRTLLKTETLKNSIIKRMFSEKIQQRIQIHLNTITFVFLVVLGGTAPLWIAWLTSKVWKLSVDFYGNGELYLIATAFNTHAIYLLFEYKKKNYDLVGLFGWISILSLVASSGLYVTSVTPPEILKESVHVDRGFVQNSSQLIFILSVVSLYYGMYKDNEKKGDIDVPGEIRGEVENLKEQLQDNP